MWKWIVGVLLVLVIAIGATCYLAIKNVTSGGDTAEVTIAATPERVFGLLANADSLPVFMRSGNVTTSRHGVLAAGDTLFIENGRTTATTQRIAWIVGDVQAPKLLVLELRDSTGQVIATRRDSLVALADSTQIISTIAAPMIDSLKGAQADTGSKVGGAILSLGSKLVVTGFRVMADQQLHDLKKHLEAKPAPAKP